MKKMKEKMKEKKEKSTARRIVGVILKIVIAVIIVALLYLAYVFISYYRIPDNQDLAVKNADNVHEYVQTNSTKSLTSWNIGFAAYLQDYTFFMDGGVESRAHSEEAVLDSMVHINKTLSVQNSDFYNIQEVDFDATRTYKVDERKLIRDNFKNYSYVFAQNYDSPYLFYPFNSPHGANKAGLITLSNTRITNSLRRSLPIQTDFAKVLDLDRCYSVSRMLTDNGKEFILVNFHLSAYTTDPTIVKRQVQMLYDTMLEEYEKGNYVVCSGDFNMDLLGDSAGIFGVPLDAYSSWCNPYPVEDIPEHINLVAPFDDDNKVASCRNNNIPYTPGKTFTCTVDGFLTTDNVQVLKSEVLDLQFKYSDHNAVKLYFRLR